MHKGKLFLLGIVICILLTLLTACSKTGADDQSLYYGRIRSDFSGVTPEIAKAYLAVVDEISAHLGYDEEDPQNGEYLHGGFVRDWDNDGTPEMCLLLKYSPKESGGWDGTPIYGWDPPTLYLYTFRNGQAERIKKCDLYFSTVGREAAIAALITENGMQYVWWDYITFGKDQNYLDCYCFGLVNGAFQEMEVPEEIAKASEGTQTAQEFLNALDSDNVQLLMYNRSGGAKLEGEANARELRAALAAKVSQF